MDVRLARIGLEDAEKLWRMQVTAFKELYDKYQDTETNPAAEPADNIVRRLKQPFTYYYFIMADGAAAGAIRVIDKREAGAAKWISPVFVMPEYRNRGLAQKAITLAEEKHGRSDWRLATILEEKGNCHLYEKMGYRLTGERKEVNEKMTLVFYEKDRTKSLL